MVTLRMPVGLIAELDQIAQETSRSRSKTIILLLRRAIESYREDGYLLDTRPKQPIAAESTSPKQGKAS